MARRSRHHAAEKSDKFASSHCLPRGSGQGILSAKPSALIGGGVWAGPSLLLARLMSALGQKQTFALHQPMSALPPKADICGATRDVRFVPIADIRARLNSKRTPFARAVSTDHF